jgi:hemin uptake protein HemP
MAATPNGSVSRAAVPAARTGACASASNTGASNTRTRWHSSQLLGAAREVEIEHGDATYRLRVTSMGKLILTK